MLSPDLSPDPGFDDKKLKNRHLKPVLWVRIFVFWMRVREDKNYPLKKIWRNFMFEELDALYWGFSCSLDVLLGGLGVTELQFLLWTNWFFLSVKFFNFGHQNHVCWSGTIFGYALTKNAGSRSGPALQHRMKKILKTKMLCMV